MMRDPPPPPLSAASLPVIFLTPLKVDTWIHVSAGLTMKIRNGRKTQKKTSECVSVAPVD